MTEARYSRSIRTSATASGAAAFELIAGLRPFVLTELGITIVNATASTFALGRPAAIGITPTSPVAPLSYANGDPLEVRARMAVAWGTGPTIPAAYFRQVTIPAVAGSEKIWQFGRITDGALRNGIVVPAGGSIILWTLSTVSVADVYVVIEE